MSPPEKRRPNLPPLFVGGLLIVFLVWVVWTWSNWGDRGDGVDSSPEAVMPQEPSIATGEGAVPADPDNTLRDTTGDGYVGTSGGRPAARPNDPVRPMSRTHRFEAAAEQIAAHEREIQQAIDARAGKGEDEGEGGAVQAGARRYPEPPFPKQHQRKPGDEAALDPAPMYEAPFWRGSGKLEGRAALITGADSGIGRAVAVLFAREGCDVAICHLDEDADADMTRQAVEAEGRKAIVLKGDIADPAFSEAAVKATLDAFGRLDVVVPNAAFQEHVERFEDLTPEHFDRTLKTNLYGYFNLTRAAVPHLKSGAAIVMTGSVTGLLGNAALLDYSMTKGGIHAYARSLGTHLAPRGIRVNVVAPGPVWTPLNPADKEADKVAQFGAQTVMKRPAQPEEIAPAYVFLASPQMSSFITGEILPIIGGYTGG